jgi:formylglycine-generating enzyme required for sulfatase activity
VPAGRYLTGNADEAIRATFSGTPLRQAETGAYFIGRHEVTMSEWITFLEAISPEEKRQRAPRAWPDAGIAVELREVAGQGWRYIFRPETGASTRR